MPYWNHALRGFLVPDQRFDVANIATADTSVTEAGPRPAGVGYSDSSRSRLVLEATGDQSQDLYAKVVTPGVPQLGRGLRCLVGTTNTPTLGWQPPNFVEAVHHYNAQTTLFVYRSCVTLPNQDVLVMQSEAGGAPYFDLYRVRSGDAVWNGFGQRFNPGNFDVGTQAAFGCDYLAALCLTRDGRVLFMTYDGSVNDTGYSLYQMDADDVMDDLSTALAAATLVAENCIPVGVVTAYRSRLYEMANGDLCLALCLGTNLELYASQDGGASWSKTYDSAALNCAPDVILTPSGKLVLLEVVSGLSARTIGSAWEDATNVDAVEIDATTSLDIVGYADPNGRIYVIYHDSSTDDARMAYSDDDGATWTVMTYGPWRNGDTRQRPRLDRATMVHAAGSGCLWTDYVDQDATYDYSSTMMVLGGFVNVEMGQDSGNDPDKEADRVAFGQAGVANTTSINFHGMTDPANLATLTSTGAGAASQAGNGWNLALAATQRYYSTPAPPVDATFVLVQWGMDLTSGGSLASAQCGLQVRLSDGANATGLQARYLAGTPDQITVVNESGGATITAAYNLPSNNTHEGRIYLEMSGRYALWVRDAAGSLDWTLVSSGTATVGASATSYIRFGGIAAASTSNSTWAYFNCIYGPETPFYRLPTSTVLVPYGRLVTAYPAPLPVRAEVASVRVGDGTTYMRAKDGPGQFNELITLPVQHDYPMEACLWQVEPSPRVQWRTTDDGADAYIGWTPTASTNDTSITRHIGVYVGNANWRTAYLEAWNGAAWVTLGTMDLTISSGLTYTRTGDTLRINGGSSATRYIWKNELIGATAQLDASTFRKINRHTEGTWQSAAGKHVELSVDITSGEPASGSALRLIAHSGLLVVHAVSALYDRYRFRIPTQTTADGDFRTGIVAIGYMQAMGQQHDWGSRADYEPQADSTVTRSGVSRVRRTGPVRRAWSWAWSEAVDLSQIRLTATTVPDWLAESSGVTEAMAHRGDVPYLLGGLLEELRSGEVPVVACGAIPTTSGTTITDPTLFLYGRITSSVGIDNVQGDEGEDEVVRVQQMTIEEIV